MATKELIIHAFERTLNDDGTPAPGGSTFLHDITVRASAEGVYEKAEQALDDLSTSGESMSGSEHTARVITKVE